MSDISMSSAQRVKLALQHKEPDRVPFDLGSTDVTGITVGAYRNLLSYLGIKKEKIPIIDIVQQVAGVDEDVLERLGTDIRGLFFDPPSNWKLKIEEGDEYSYFTDQWGIGWKMPKKRGYYYDMYHHPLKRKITEKDIDSYPWPEPRDPARIEGMKEKIKKFEEKDKATLVGPIEAGFFELSFWMRGFSNFFMDLAADPSLACYLMDKLLELRIACWEMILKELGNYILIAREGDDLGVQKSTMVSLEMYRKYIKPRHKELFSYIKKTAPKPIYIFFHTCGSVYNIIPDLIEIGVDILNPIQVSAAKMNTKKLKKEFDKDLTFWGGGVDTQDILPHSSPQQVKDEVKRRINDLAPGGGFIFSAVHNIQPDVPPKNIMAMCDAVKEFGKY